MLSARSSLEYARAGLTGGRLRLAGLPRASVFLASLSLTATALAALIITAEGFGWSLPGRMEKVTPWATLPASVTVVVVIALAVAAGTLAYAAAYAGRPLARLALTGLGLTGAALAGDVLVRLERTRDFVPIGVATEILAWLAFGVALAAAAVPGRLAVRRRGWAAALVSLPFVVVFLAYMTAHEELRAAPDAFAGFPDEISARTAVAGSIVSIAAGIGFAVGVVFFWQALEVVRASRELGVALAGATAFAPGFLVALLTIKLVWLGLGYTRLLPGGLGDSEVWSRSRGDGWSAWVIAALLAGGVTASLLRWRQPTGEPRGLTSAVGAVVLGWMLFVLLANLSNFVATAAEPFDPFGAAEFSRRLANWFADNILWSQVGVVLAAAAMGVMLVRRRTAGAMFLLFFGIWALPRAVGVLLEPDGRQTPPVDLSVDLVTLDTCLTVALAAAAAIIWRRGDGTRSYFSLITTALIVSTAVGYSLTALFLPGNPRLVLYLTLLFPIAWTFLMECGPLNRPHPRRVGRVLAATGGAALATVGLCVWVVFGWISPDRAGNEYLAEVLFAAPFAAVIVGLTVPSVRALSRQFTPLPARAE